MEIWKDIIGYEGVYQVSNIGRVKRIGTYKNQSMKEWDSDKVLKPATKSNGYMFVGLSKYGKVSHRHIHRLVAEVFIPNPLNKPTVNHKDGDRSNNIVENLEWATYSENNIHSIKVLKRDSKNSSDSRPVLQFDKEGNFIKEYPSMREAQRQTGIDAIDKVCNHYKYRKTAGGYKWEYKDNYNKSVETIETTSK
ncbi:HNH endonuclease [Clostridium algidicarnis]|uniref:NUMOD4 domain-containing protein n=1 Tax=Clostridium algidicarnis TaxID=37659 RepID=UPI001C0BD12B|nr:NUMOD4 domain-containing protein [Clostridium algidicarnis]MBU3205583.1 HNH endonuclease [Clostridium algidicarnis]